MIAEIRNIVAQIKTFERATEEFLTKAEQVKNDNVELAKENQSLKDKITELELKLKEHENK